MNCLCRTTLFALAAAYAFFVVNMCGVVFNLDCIVLADLLAFHTADTAYRTLFSCKCALVMNFTGNNSLCFIKGHELDKSLGTNLYALLASRAHKRVNPCNAVDNAYGTVLTNIYTVAVAYTAVYTFLRTAEQLRSHFTAHNALVLKLFL